MKEQIIEYIRRNRVSTTEVSDCLEKTGSIPNILPLSRGHFYVGNVFYTYASGESNWNVHDEIRSVKEGDIVFVNVYECNDRAVLGELVSKYLLLYKQASAVIVNGNVRDANSLLKENYAVWCKGVNPVGCFNNDKFIKPEDSVLEKHKNFYNGSIAVCDDCGVVIIPKSNHTEEFYNKVVAIEEQEDMWFDCIDRLKWDTYDTVCLKKYENMK